MAQSHASVAAGLARSEARRLGAKVYIGSPCRKYGHYGKRKTSTGNCVSCGIMLTIRWQRLNPGRCRAAEARYRTRLSGLSRAVGVFLGLAANLVLGLGSSLSCGALSRGEAR